MTGAYASREIQKQTESLADCGARLLKTAKVTAPFQYTATPGLEEQWLSSEPVSGCRMLPILTDHV